MNTTILSRCIDELKTPEPDISYIRGALETLLEMSDPQPALGSRSLDLPSDLAFKPHGNQTREDELPDPGAGAVLDRYLGNGTVGAVTS